MLRKMRLLGCSEIDRGPGDSPATAFNLDGTNIYMTMAAMFRRKPTAFTDPRQQLWLL